jgi:hypothetical protein
MRSMSNVSSVRFARFAFAAAVVALFAGCGSDSTGPKNANVAGTYSLTTVNGQSLPFTVTNTGEDVEIVQDATITLTSDSTYSVSANGTLNGSDATLLTDAGHYVVSGNQITFTSTIFTGGHYTASFTSGPSSRSLTATIPGAVVGSSDISFSLLFTNII